MFRISCLLSLVSIIFSVDYNSEIQPIFDSNCGNCHLGNSSGGLNLSSYLDLMEGGNSGDAVEPGNSSSSVLFDRITRENSDAGDMPPGNSELSQSDIDLIAQWIDDGALEFESTCEEGYTEISDIPLTCIVFDGSSCFHDGDLQVLSEVAESNNISDLTPLYLGSQNWLSGRLKRIQIGDYFQGGNINLTSLPESIGTLEDLTTLQVDKNDLTSLPESIGDLSILNILIASNNDIVTVPESIGELTQVWYLDLGYNVLQTLPHTISGMESLLYLYIFGNEMTSLPESICDLNLDWSGYDNAFMPYFACGGNQLCDDIPDCVETSDNFEIGLEANYYSFTINLPQDCGDSCGSGDVNVDYVLDVLDIVMTINFVLGNSEPTDEQFCNADMNQDSTINVLDIVTMIDIILN